MVKAQEWLDREYPNKRVREIYVNGQLEGELDLADYNKLEKVSISFQICKSKLEIKNKREDVKIIQLIDAQKYLQQRYPVKKERKKIKRLDIDYKNLEGRLDLFDLNNLEELSCSNNKLTSLNIDNCAKLRKIWCYNNQLTSLDLSNLNQLSLLDFSHNYFTQMPYLPNSGQLVYLNTSNNNFPQQTLTIFSRFRNLEELRIGNWNKNKIDQGICNCLIGSLEPLKNLNGLKKLDISNTELKNGVEYLPDNLEEIKYDTELKTNCKLVEIKEQLDLFIKRKYWKKFGLTLQQGLEWVQVGAKPDDYKFVVWLRDAKQETPQWVANYQEDYQILSKRFKKYGVCSECGNLNTGEQWCQSCNSQHLEKDFPNWTSGNQEVDQFIQKHQKTATETGKLLEWIPYEQFANVEYLTEGGFGKVYKAQWKKGNISYWDIRNKQWSREKDHYYEKEDKNKQDYEQDKRGWSKDNSNDYELNKERYKKYKDYKTVVLKSLNNSSENTNFLQETANHKIIDDWFNNIVPCYGISQDPQTGNYLMVMEYVEGGNLRNYLTTKKLTFQDKLQRLTHIIQGLKDVHQKNLVHRDFHSGNILNNEIHSFITDLGLCKKVDETNQEKEIYGVLPYVAPEVLRNKGYALASDIYSLGMVTYEIFANQSPYLDKNYDTLLAIEICQDLRPNLDELKIPQSLKDLIQQCWNADPQKRPTSNEIERILRNWQKDAEFTRQLKEIEVEYNQISEKTIYKSHPTAIMTSKRIDTKQITKKLETMEYSVDLAFDFGQLNLENQNWNNIHPNFTSELIQSWTNLNFTYQQTQDWINIGLQPTDYNFCAWIRDNKQLTAEWVLNEGNLEQLNQEFFNWWQGQQQSQIEVPPK